MLFYYYVNLCELYMDSLLLNGQENLSQMYLNLSNSIRLIVYADLDFYIICHISNQMTLEICCSLSNLFQKNGCTLLSNLLIYMHLSHLYANHLYSKQAALFTPLILLGIITISLNSYL